MRFIFHLFGFGIMGGVVGVAGITIIEALFIFGLGLISLKSQSFTFRYRVSVPVSLTLKNETGLSIGIVH